MVFTLGVALSLIRGSWHFFFFFFIHSIILFGPARFLFLWIRVAGVYIHIYIYISSDTRVTRFISLLCRYVLFNELRDDAFAINYITISNPLGIT